MKVIKKTKERVLSIVLAFAMVLSSMTGLAPMEVRAEEAGEQTEKAIYDTEDRKLYNPNYTYNSATSMFTILLEEPETDYEYRYFVTSDISSEYGADSANSDDGQYRRERNFSSATTVTNNSFEIQKGKGVYLYYCPANTSVDDYPDDEDTIKAIVLLAREDGSIYGGLNRNGTTLSLVVDEQKLSEIYDNGVAPLSA